MTRARAPVAAALLCGGVLLAGCEGTPAGDTGGSGADSSQPTIAVFRVSMNPDQPTERGLSPIVSGVQLESTPGSWDPDTRILAGPVKVHNLTGTKMWHVEARISSLTPVAPEPNLNFVVRVAWYSSYRADYTASTTTVSPTPEGYAFEDAGPGGWNYGDIGPGAAAPRSVMTQQKSESSRVEWSVDFGAGHKTLGGAAPVPQSGGRCNSARAAPPLVSDGSISVLGAGAITPFAPTHDGGVLGCVAQARPEGSRSSNCSS